MSVVGMNRLEEIMNALVEMDKHNDDERVANMEGTM